MLDFVQGDIYVLVYSCWFTILSFGLFMMIDHNRFKKLAKSVLGRVYGYEEISRMGNISYHPVIEKGIFNYFTPFGMLLFGLIALITGIIQLRKDK